MYHTGSSYADGLLDGVGGLAIYYHWVFLRGRRRCFAGAERGSRASQFVLNVHCERVRSAEYAPHGRCRILVRPHGLAEIVERGGGVLVERPRVIRSHFERESMPLSENASCHGNRSAYQHPGLFEALCFNKCGRVVVGRLEGLFMFFAVWFQAFRVHVSPYAQGLFKPS